MSGVVSREEWATTRVRAEMWWCGDEVCDCTQPLIVSITPNYDAGYPWVRRVPLWEGEFLTLTESYTREEREGRQFAPWREACARLGLPVPELARPR